MKFSNTTVDDIKKEYRVLAMNKTIGIEILCSKHGKYLLPDKDGNKIVSVEFKNMTVDNYWFIDKISNKDYEYFKKYVFKFCLIRWNLDEILEIDNEILTDDCLNRIMKLPAPLMNAIFEKYQESYIINDEEEQEITRQSAILFSKNTSGVSDACEGITLFCVLGNFWEKFGINRFDIKNLSYKEYVMLRMILNNEVDKTKATRRREEKKAKTMIAGPGGKTRPSRGITVEG